MFKFVKDVIAGGKQRLTPAVPSTCPHRYEIASSNGSSSTVASPTVGNACALCQLEQEILSPRPPRNHPVPYRDSPLASTPTLSSHVRSPVPDPSLPTTQSIIETIYPPDRADRGSLGLGAAGRARSRTLETGSARPEARHRRVSDTTGLGISMDTPTLPATTVGASFGDTIRDALPPSGPTPALNALPSSSASSPTSSSPSSAGSTLSFESDSDSPRADHQGRGTPYPLPRPTLPGPPPHPSLYPAPRLPSSINNTEHQQRRRAALQTLAAMAAHSDLLDVPRAPRIAARPFPAPPLDFWGAAEEWAEPPPAYGRHMYDLCVESGRPPTYRPRGTRPRRGGERLRMANQ